MNPEFWHSKWDKKEIGFDQAQPNTLLQSHFSSLRLSKGDRVFIPLCGKTIDIHWLLDQGYRVVGAELNESAVRALFQALKLEAKVIDLDHLKHYSAEGIDIFVGDIFALDAEILGPVNAVYDRAALVALPLDVRGPYTAHLKKLTSSASQLLITFLYEQSEMPGPPFSIPTEEIERHYGSSYKLEELESRAVEGKLKGRVEALERVHRLS